MEKVKGRMELKSAPLRPGSNAVYWISLLLAMVIGSSAILGLLNPAGIYPSPALQETALANDAVTLLFGMPLLVFSMWLARRGELIGWLLWPASLLYNLYNFLAYIFVMPISPVYLLYLTAAALIPYLVIGLFARLNIEAMGELLKGPLRERLSGGILMVLGSLFIVRAFGIIASASSAPELLPATERAVLIPDVLLSPAWIVGGFLLWQRKGLGYAAGAVLLAQASMLFAGLILVMLLQPLFFTVPVVLGDILVVLFMGLFCFIPTFWYLRGAAKAGEVIQ